MMPDCKRKVCFVVRKGFGQVAFEDMLKYGDKKLNNRKVCF